MTRFGVIAPSFVRCSTVFFCAVFGAGAEQPAADLLRHWDYDRTAPLDIQQSGVEKRDGVTIYDLSYATPTGDRTASIGPNGGRVTAYLVAPSGAGPFPAIIYGHWCMPGSARLNRTEFLEEAIVLARSGVLSLLPDHVIARPGYVADNSPLNKQQVDVLVQQVVNTRRGADLLLARKDVDPKRLAYVGHSCNAQVGALLSGIDKRFKAIVIMAAPLSDEIDMKSEMYQQYREKVGPERFDAFVATYSWTDPGKYVSRSGGVAKLLQFATDEPYLTGEHARAYLPYVSEPRTLKIYEAPHALNAEAARDRVAFLARELRFTMPDARALASIPKLEQPPWPDELRRERKQSATDNK
jgi:dienelactone hydrolase